MQITFANTIPDTLRQMQERIDSCEGVLDEAMIQFNRDMLNVLILPNLQGFIDQWTIWDKAEYQSRERLEEDFFKDQKNFVVAIQGIPQLREQISEEDIAYMIIRIINYIQRFIEIVIEMDPPPPNQDLFLKHIFEVILKSDPKEE